MALYTVEAFRWTGTYYNAQYNTSYTAVLDDDDANFQGSGDANELVSINGGAFGTTTGSPYAINVSFTDTGGSPHVETFYFFNTGGSWYFVPAPGSDFTVGATLGSYQNHSNGWTYSTVTCFVAGTLIETKRGQIPVERLRAGDLIRNDDGDLKPLRMNLSTQVDAQSLRARSQLRPIKISAGSLGAGMPLRDLYVSRQHRMVVSSPVTKRMFGETDALVAAARLLDVPGIYVDDRDQCVAYHHLVFDDHEVVLAEGAPSESLFLGAGALESIPHEAQLELEALFGDLGALQKTLTPARYLPERLAQKALIARHIKNSKPILESRSSI